MLPSAPIVTYPACTAALVAWFIALFEYLLQVPANRIGYTVLTLAQHKIMREVTARAVFVPFAVMIMGENRSTSTACGRGCA